MQEELVASTSTNTSPHRPCSRTGFNRPPTAPLKTPNKHDAIHDDSDDSDPDDDDLELELDTDVIPDDSIPPTSPLPTSPPSRTFTSPLYYSYTLDSEEDGGDGNNDIQAPDGEGETTGNRSQTDRCHTYTISYSPPRHQYPEHGYSRSKLSHLQWFWGLRQDAWAYDGLRSPEPDDSTSTNNRNNATSNGSPSSPQATTSTTSSSSSTPPLTIHPRRGDISALRDPYSAHVDRCFHKLPLWTMSKTLWMFDLHVAVTREQDTSSPAHHILRRRSKCAAIAVMSDSDTDAEDDELDLNMSNSALSLAGTNKSTSGEDSDVTLVESESEDGWSVVSPTASSPVSPSSSRPPSCFFNQPPTILKDKLVHEEETNSGDEEEEEEEEEEEDEYACVPRVWAKDWYSRWELLVRLVRLDQEKKRARAAKMMTALSNDEGEEEEEEERIPLGTT